MSFIVLESVRLKYLIYLVDLAHVQREREETFEDAPIGKELDWDAVKLKIETGGVYIMKERVDVLVMEQIEIPAEKYVV